jgi:hypothetical protein
MNTNGCEPGLFTDRILNYASAEDEACTSPVVGWLTLSVICVLFRIAHASRICFVLYRKKSLTSTHYVLLALHALTVSFAIVFFVLTSLNIANVENSLSAFLVSLFLFTVGSIHLLFVKKMISLGKRIIPISRAMTKEDSFLLLETEDTLVKCLMAFSFICMCGTVLSLFLQFILVSQNIETILPFQFGMGITAISQVFAISVTLYQFERCKRAIWRTAEGDMHRSIIVAAKKMTRRQLAIISFMAPFALLLILCGFPSVLPLRWWILIIGSSSDIFLLVASSIVEIARSFVLHSKSSSETQQGQFLQLQSGNPHKIDNRVSMSNTMMRENSSTMTHDENLPV